MSSDSPPVANPDSVADGEPVIRARDLGKIYQLYDKPADRLKQAFLWGRKQFYREFWAVRGVSFDVQRGEVMGLIGRNGSGKSTLLQLVCGILQPSAGSVEIRGRAAALLELGSGFNPDFTGRENVYLNASILGLTRREIDERFDRIVRFAEIGEFLDQPVKTYSSGMVVRLAFAIAVHVDADVLVVDEALSVGDAPFQFKCLHHLEELLSRGVTILLVSHDVQLVKSYCTRAIYLKNNAIAYQGDCETATELYMQDMRKEKDRMLADAAGSAPTPAPILSPASGRGEILSVEIGAGSEQRASFREGERVWVDVTARLSRDLHRPRLTLIVRDIKGYRLFGLHNQHCQIELSPDASGLIRGRFWFTCNLSDGDYSVVVRLEDCLTDSLRVIVDKRLNARTFKVLADQQRFLGVVDLEGKFEVGRIDEK
jgi:lipopolysaccharide transport system ATP-binding protein